MEKYKEDFADFLEKLDKENCLMLALKVLEEGIYSVRELYEQIIIPAYGVIEECIENDEGCIWKEHVKTSIVRTVIESAYMYVIKEKKNILPVGKKIVLICPEREYHEIGLRIIKDFFILNGYETVYIGGNTPRNQALYVVNELKPEYLALSVTGYYLLSESKKLIDNIRNSAGYPVKILVGGNAFKNNMSCVKSIGADKYLNSFEDIKLLRESDLKK